MAAVWAEGEATVRSVTDAVAENADRPRSYTTILTVMIRLADKGFLERRREGKRDIYVAAIDRDTYQRARAATEFDAMIEEYGDLALTHFARLFSNLSPAHQRALRRRARGD